MSPSGTRDLNYELVIIRISPTVVYVVEALKEIGFEASTYKNSLLVYKVDSSVESGFGPIQIIPKKTATTTAPLSPSLPDWIRFQEAPLRKSEQVLYNKMLFRNVKTTSGATYFSVFTGASAITESKIKSKKLG